VHFKREFHDPEATAFSGRQDAENVFTEIHESWSPSSHELEVIVFAGRQNAEKVLTESK
jgi:hypothetical protein